MDTQKNGQEPQAVPLTSDLVFKYVFGGEHSAGYLRSLFSAVREDVGYPAVTSVEITNPFNVQDAIDSIQSVAGVRARDAEGNTFVVEVHSCNHKAFQSQVLYHWARTYSGQFREDDYYTKPDPLIGINLLGFRHFPEEAGVPRHTTFVPRSMNAPALPPLPDMVLHFLELPQYDLQTQAPSTALERWLYFIVNRGKEDAMKDPIMRQILEESPDIAEAERRYEELIADEQLKSRLDARGKSIRTQAQLLHDAEERGKEECKAAGRTKDRF
ncbi:MAG: Rpn family recombination-promoting nuclease/putative transposase [Spirochaetaceae bacterium]|nr:MAG: Rpn family recombination-promoting nuclease/putative transposase [Spirochaetaceae bacterium]